MHYPPSLLVESANKRPQLTRYELAQSSPLGRETEALVRSCRWYINVIDRLVSLVSRLLDPAPPET